MCSLHKIAVSFIVTFFTIAASGGIPVNLHTGAGEAGMSYASVTGNGFWSAFHNQALLGLNRQTAVAVNYENRFGLAQLSTSSIAARMPAGSATLGAIWSHTGSRDYSWSEAGAACGLKLSEKLLAGVQIDLLTQKSAGEYSDNRALTFETGILLQVSENTYAGIHLFNPIPNSIRSKTMPSAIRAGAGTWFNKAFFAAAEAELATGGIPEFRTGFQYEILKSFQIRGGYCSSNNSFSFGMGWTFKGSKADIAFITHDKLGVSSCFSLIFAIR